MFEEELSHFDQVLEFEQSFNLQSPVCCIKLTLLQLVKLVYIVLDVKFSELFQI